ncbi:uncharacterized protein CXQ87_003305 [Candidozyma duobushaemuli]|uniref:Uncharacterized protein n=1 Tax=Candidozyma duobushaemuli TaxID=1231522 RepID=A0A2V1AD58_9ASCO|nr:uncharacterized protein CXQ87_003305 [[Candida] duobushaemulonis]PVH15464.1 hypothetical protein CXQ87_003305 [[Candida] duobushaemulonis]
MLSQLAWPLSVLHLWFPLLLSAKALSRPAENIQFLLHYWLWYLGLTHVQFYLQLAPFQGLLTWPLPFSRYGFSTATVASYYRLVLSGGHGGGIYRPYRPGFRGKEPVFQSTMSVLERSGIARFASSLFAFNHELCRSVSWPKRPSCLHLGVDFFCYMDSPRELAQRLQSLERFIFGIRSAVSPAVSPSQKVSRSTSKVDYNDRNEFYSPKREFSPREVHSPNRLHTLSPTFPENNSPLVRKTRRKPPEERRVRSASVGSIDDSALPYPLETAPERSVSEVIFNKR